jgi:hypothetical protein
MIIQNPNTLAFLDVFSPASGASVEKTAVIKADGKNYQCIWNRDGYTICDFKKAELMNCVRRKQ